MLAAEDELRLGGGQVCDRVEGVGLRGVQGACVFFKSMLRNKSVKEKAKETHVLPCVEGIAPAVACGEVSQPSAAATILLYTKVVLLGSVQRLDKRYTHEVESIGRRVNDMITLGSDRRCISRGNPHPGKMCSSIQ